MLIDPLEELTYGWACGEEGEKPCARRAMERLVAAGEARLLGNAAKGPNPEGRLYAVEGLYELARRGKHELTAGEKRLAATIVGLELKIRWCDKQERGETRAKAVKDWVLKGEPAPPPPVMDWKP